LILKLLTGFLADLKNVSPQSATIRVVRASRVYGMGDVKQRIMDNAAYQRHVALVAKDDAVFFLSHRHYLAQGLAPTQRAEAALHHYEHEVDAFDQCYFEAVYERDGLLLWQGEAEGAVFDIRLEPGNDVLYEGGMSLVFRVDGVRACVVSYSLVPAPMVMANDELAGPEAEPLRSVIFVTRKHLTALHEYQKIFNKAFDRTTPAHLCVGALTGIALAQGHRKMVGIKPDVHPSLQPGREAAFHTTYTEFWESLAGRPTSAFGYAVDLPMRMTPLVELDAKARKRAVSRRRHVEDARNKAHDIIRQHLVNAPPAMALPSVLDEAAEAQRMARDARVIAIKPSALGDPMPPPADTSGV
jgi:uncharacterized protein VirK/YbjX